MFYNNNNNYKNNFIPIRQKLFTILSSTIKNSDSSNNSLNKSQSFKDYSKFRVSISFYKTRRKYLFTKNISSS